MSAEYKTRTMHSYDTLAAELSAGFDGFFETFARREADCFLEGLDREAVLLDLGCGGGPASRYFAGRGYAVVSADLSREMLRACREGGLERLVRLDLEALPFRRPSLDGIWAHTSLLHVPKSRLCGALAALGATLRPGGRLFVALKEGVGQGYEGRRGAERWFSRFQEGEFERYVPRGLQVVQRGRTALNRTVFLNYHLVVHQRSAYMPTERAD